jgi:hypothetical protein
VGSPSVYEAGSSAGARSVAGLMSPTPEAWLSPELRDSPDDRSTRGSSGGAHVLRRSCAVMCSIESIRWRLFSFVSAMGMQYALASALCWPWALGGFSTLPHLELGICEGAA